MPSTFTGENRHPRTWPLAHLTSALRFYGKTLKTALQSESAGQRHKPGQSKGSMERGEILARLRERIVAFAASRISKEAAEDLAQEVLIVMHEKYTHVTDLSELLPLSLQVLRWKMLDLHRKSVRRGEYNQVAVEDLALANPGDNPDTTLERKEMLEQLIAGMTLVKPPLSPTVPVEVARQELRGDPIPAGPELDQHRLHLGFSVSQTAPGLDGRVLGRNGCARRARAVGLSLAPLERGA